MISIVYEIEAGERYSVTMEGHADGGEYGQDVVCAAASMLVYTLAENVRRLSEGGANKSTRIQLDSGLADIRIAPNNRIKEETETIFEAICAGFELLSEHYPDNVEYDIVMG